MSRLGFERSLGCHWVEGGGGLGHILGSEGGWPHNPNPRDKLAMLSVGARGQEPGTPGPLSGEPSRA